MYEFYTTTTGVLSSDDINGIHHIYGVPKKSTEAPPTTTLPDIYEIPDKCETSYDAVATIKGELYIFKGIYMWRPKYNSSAIEIRNVWKELPANITHVDAVYENDDGKLLFFIGRNIYGFSGTTFQFKSSLTQLGIDHHYNKIDAVFKWNYNKLTYMFSGDQYWRLEGKMVNRHYPKDIERAWHDVYDIDAAYSDNEKLYFFKGNFFYEFDEVSMQLDRMNPQSSAAKFMKCAGDKKTFKIHTRFGDENVDVIDDGVADEKEDDKDNIEKLAQVEVSTMIPPVTTSPDNAATHTLLLSIMLGSLVVSRVLPSILLYI
jgi:hypothetical protein